MDEAGIIIMMILFIAAMTVDPFATDPGSHQPRWEPTVSMLSRNGKCRRRSLLVDCNAGAYWRGYIFQLNVTPLPTL